MDKIVIDYLKEFGYDGCVDENQGKRVSEWLDIYKGPTKKYEIKIYNGKNYTNYKIKSLNLPSQVCGDLADFFFNEKLDITMDNKEVGEKIAECLNQNNFLDNSNKLMQLVKALGTGALVPYLDNNVLKINYVKATNIVILKADENEVIDVLFWRKTKTKNGYEYFLNLHVLEDNGYVIYNARKNEKGKNLELDNVKEKIQTDSFIPKFGMLFTPEVNNIDIDSPYGISCYANAIDPIFVTDRAYDSMDNEIYLGRKKVYVSAGALDFNTNNDNDPVPVFDPNDIEIGRASCRERV